MRYRFKGINRLEIGRFGSSGLTVSASLHKLVPGMDRQMDYHVPIDCYSNGVSLAGIEEFLGAFRNGEQLCVVKLRKDEFPAKARRVKQPPPLVGCFQIIPKRNEDIESSAADISHAISRMYRSISRAGGFRDFRCRGISRRGLLQDWSGWFRPIEQALILRPYRARLKVRGK